MEANITQNPFQLHVGKTVPRSNCNLPLGYQVRWCTARTLWTTVDPWVTGGLDYLKHGPLKQGCFLMDIHSALQIREFGIHRFHQRYTKPCTVFTVHSWWSLWTCSTQMWSAHYGTWGFRCVQGLLQTVPHGNLGTSAYTQELHDG